MKVKKSSWHYKLAYDVLNFKQQPNLCRYFWTVVVSCFLLTMMGAAALSATVFLTYPIWQIFTGVVEGAVVGAMVLWPAAGAFAITTYRETHLRFIHWPTEDTPWYHRSVSYYFRFLFPEKSGEAFEREPSVFGEYLRAKKQKICPFIEYVDE